MQHEVYSNATNRVIATFATEAEAYRLSNTLNAPRHGMKAPHWSRKAIVRVAKPDLAAMQTVGAA